METKNYNIPGLVSSGVLALSTFFPIAKIDLGIVSQGVSLMNYWAGIFILMSAIAAGYLIYTEMKWAVVAGGVALVMSLISIFTYKSSLGLGGALMGIRSGVNVSIGFGVFIALGASIAVIFFSFKYWNQES